MFQKDVSVFHCLKVLELTAAEPVLVNVWACLYSDSWFAVYQMSCCGFIAYFADYLLTLSLLVDEKSRNLVASSLFVSSGNSS